MVRRAGSAALVLLAFAGLTRCDAPKVSLDGHTGVRLEQLDLAGKTVHDVTLLGPDTLTITRGLALTIHATGDPAAVRALRFVLTDGRLGVGRQPDAVVGNGIATIAITTPLVDRLTVAGSGSLTTDRLAGGHGETTVGGSGHIVATNIATDRLSVEVLGSGSFTGSGHSPQANLTLAGSGDADLGALTTDSATIDLTGTGSGKLSSDGHVTGALVGTGSIIVHGRAHCDVAVTGTGQIVCGP